MGHNGSQREGAYPGGPLRCPVCGAVLEVRLLELAEDSDKPETLVLLDCPQGHIHATLTHQDIIAALTAEVRERLRR